MYSALDTNNFFIVADRDLHNIYHVEYPSGMTTELPNYIENANPFAVAYDPTTKSVYWSDIRFESISRYSLLDGRSGNRTTIYVDNAGR